MKIKRAIRKDLDKIFYIIQSANRKLLRNGKEHWKGFYTKEKISKIILMEKVFLVYENKKPIGTFTLSENEPELYKEKFVTFSRKSKQKTIYLSALAVLPIEQQKGYGKRIMNLIEIKSKREKFSSIVFDVVSDYPELNKFYKKLNYKIIGKIKGKLREGNIYSKTL